MAPTAANRRAHNRATNKRRGRPFEPWSLRPGQGTRFLGSGRWLAETDDPQFLITPPDGRIRPGVHEIRITSSVTSETPLTPRIYFDCGAGLSEATALQFPTMTSEYTDRIMIPEGCVAFRLDPIAQSGGFHLEEIALRRVPTTELLRQIRRLPGGRRSAISALVARSPDWSARFGAVNNDSKAQPSDYQAWLERYEPRPAEARPKIREFISTLPAKPLISIVMPAYNSNPDWLNEAIHSVRQQVWENWELCIVDDCSPKPETWETLQQAAETDPRIKVARLEKNGGISAATNAALDLANGEWVAFMDHDDTIRPDALALMAVEIVQNPDARIIYTDEDKIDEKHHRSEPYMKGGWNRELFYAQNYLNHFTTVRRDVLNKAGPLRSEFDGSQDYDLLLRCIEQVSDEAIVHLPFVCYHWRFATHRVNFSMTQGDRAFEAGMRALNEHFERTGQPAVSERAGPHLSYTRAKWRMDPPPLVSLIIPTRDRKSILETAITSIVEKSTYPNYEILIVDNDSADPATLKYFADLQNQGVARIIPAPGPFNFSRINNIAAREAKGEILGFVNNDVEVRSPQWIDEMVSHFARSDVGATGAKLYFPDGRIQHAGVVTGIGGVAGHIYKLAPGDAPGPFSLLNLPRETTGATAACLFVRKELFEEVGGFNETDLTVAFNDVDLCLKIRKTGAKIVWTPFAELTHFESVSRGADTDPEKQARFAGEVRYMQQTWTETALEADPYYSPNLTLKQEDASFALPPRARRPWD